MSAGEVNAVASILLMRLYLNIFFNIYLNIHNAIAGSDVYIIIFMAFVLCIVFFSC